MTALDIYNCLLDRGTSPALTLYGPSAGTARLELSGKVVANHVAKAANLLTDDIMIDPGQDVKIDLPPHWRLLTWTLGALIAGGRVTPEAADVVVTTNPDADGDDVIVVSLGALDLSWPGDLPGGVIDGNADVLSQADTLLDGSNAAESNVDDLLAQVATSASRILIVDPCSERLVSVFLSSVLAGKTLVVADTANAQRAVAAEGAELYPL